LENRLSKTLLRHHGYAPEIVAQRNKIARNLQLLELAIEEMPDEPNLLMNYGLELIRSGQFAQGLDQHLAAFRILRSRPKDEVVPELRESLLTQLCTHLMAAKRFEEIVAMLGSPLAREHGGLTASLHFALGLAQIELRQYVEAADQFRQCLAKRDKPSLTPMNRDIRRAGPHHCLAICLVNLKQYEAAGAAFQAALAEDPQSRRVRFDFAVFLANRGSAIEALKHLHTLIAEKGDEIAVWQLGGKIALGHLQFSEFACDWTGEALKFFPAEPSIICQRAEALLLKGRAEEALPLWRQSLVLNNPSHVAARMICELCTDQRLTPIAANSERPVSVEFLKWYQRFLKTGASALVTTLNERVDRFGEQLPTAADGLRGALMETEPTPV
jgi:tetratricopeptide (TPR) repeat protein